MSATPRRLAWTVCVAALAGAAVAASSGAPDLSGRWAMIQVYSEIAMLPIVGERPRISVVAQYVDLVQSGSAIVMIDTYCFTDVDDGTPLVRTEVPDEFMASLRPTPHTARLLGSSDGSGFRADEYVEVRGARLADPALEELPVSPDDPRVFDQDGDGFPGMSVRVRILGLVEGTAYVVQRVRYSLDGVVVDANTIRGTIRWATEQASLGASTPLLRVDAPARPDPDASRSVFLIVRVGKADDCSLLRARLPEWLRVLGVPLP